MPAFLVPAAFNLAAWHLVVHPRDFISRTVPYMLGVRDYFNSSIEGNGVYFGLPFWLIHLLRILFTLLAIGSLWLLYRYYRTRDPLFWFTTSSGVLLLWSWLVLALAQGYYSMMLFPFLMTVVLPNSVIRNWPAWLGIYGFLTMDRWLLFNWMDIGRPLEYLKITYGWSLLLIVVFCGAVLPLPGREGRKPLGRRHRSGMADASATSRYRGGMSSQQQQQPKLQLSDDEWRKKLNPQEFDVLRRAGTERPFVGEYTDTKTEGVYQCRACGAELFRSTEKFESHCGWPSFFDPADSDAVILRPDHSLGATRVEVVCANCHSHLGHVFEGEGYQTPTDQRYCINSISLRLIPS